MTDNNSKRKQIESDANNQISNEVKEGKKEHQNVVYNDEHVAITADRSFAHVCTGNAVIHIEKKVLQTNGRG